MSKCWHNVSALIKMLDVFMIWTDFSPQLNLGLLNVSNKPLRSLSDLFPSPSAYIPNWELSNSDIERTSSPESESVVRNPYFQKMKSGNQNECSGPIDFGLAEDYCEALNDLVDSTNIVFSKERLVENLTGGTCSAMAFQFADDYLQRKPYFPTEQIINEICEKYKHSKTAFRTIQAAFNTLHRDSRYPSEDFLCDKVASMLRFYDRYISNASELFYIESCASEEDKDAYEKIGSFLDKFSEGVFVIRCVLLEDNDKGEAYGHTTLLIKTPMEQYFYDPDEGIFKLTKDVEIEALHQLVKRMMLKSAVPFGRIYKIEDAMSYILSTSMAPKRTDSKPLG